MKTALKSIVFTTFIKTTPLLTLSYCSGAAVSRNPIHVVPSQGVALPTGRVEFKNPIISDTGGLLAFSLRGENARYGGEWGYGAVEYLDTVRAVIDMNGDQYERAIIERAECTLSGGKFGDAHNYVRIGM